MASEPAVFVLYIRKLMKKNLIFAAVLSCFFAGFAEAQQTVYLVDGFDPGGVGGNIYSNGQIGNVWANWFGSGFQSLAWDSANDASNNPASGSMKITANFSTNNNQFEVYDGQTGINPPLNGALYTNFQCDVRFAPGSATTTNSDGTVTFGHLQFGDIILASYGQDYFGSVDVPSTNTNWVHVSVPINVTTDSNLNQINDVLIHIYAPNNPSSPLNGSSTLWVDNIQFTGPPLPTNGACTVDSKVVFQRIDGFGASSAWDGLWTTAQADMFFSTNSGIGRGNNGSNFAFNGIGLSLLRSRIAPGGTTIEQTIMQMAQTRGAKVWSTPWSPAANFKNNNNITNGGFIGNTANYQAYASQLAGYVVSMKNTYGVNLYALSVQNEPDAIVSTYESCNWSAQQIHDFVPYLYNALAASNVSSTKIVLPESQNWQDYSNLTVTAMNDPNVAADVGIVADHNYDGNSGPASLVKNSYGKALWETEVSLLSGSDSSIANGVYYAGRIHLFMTSAQVNAWHYWWLISGAGGNEGLADNNGIPAKRMYTTGNFSRFVRPNYYRINVANSTGPILVSAYKDSVSSNFAIVAINSSPVTVTQVFNLTNFTTASVTPWITSANLSLVNQTPVTVTNTSFSYPLPGMSVVTFVGQSNANLTASLAAISNQTVNAGVNFSVTNIATDPQSPPYTLTYSLLANPSFATLNTSNGVITWRPHVSQAGSTNLFTVKVADNAPSSLSATNSFTVAVNPLSQTHVTSTTLGGQLQLQATGTQGPDYTLLTSTNLTTWQTLWTTNSQVVPVTFVITNIGTLPEQFYRIQLGP
jgi:glucuronoarabinoxylan endo-1,4-beta-xylanase